MRRGEQIDYEEGAKFTDPSLFNMFDFHLLRGNTETALTAPNSVVLTPAIAQKYFGNEDPIGQNLDIEWRGKTFSVTVEGLLAPAPSNSHLQFELLISYATLQQAFSPRMFASWFNKTPATYLLLKEGAAWQSFETKMQQFIQDHVATNFPNREIWFTYFIQPLTDIHLNQMGLPIQAEGNLRYIYIFLIVALAILLIACINYMNLSTARSTKRAKEVGVRKVLGAFRKQLAGQFLTEGLLFSVASFVLALALINLFLPVFNTLTGKALAVEIWTNWRLLGAMLGISLLTGMFASSYPALVLSSFRPSHVLKQALPAGKKGQRLRKALVVGQFVCGVVLIIGTLVIFSQLRYMQDKKLGFDKERVVAVPLRSQNLIGRLATLKSELRKLPGIEAITISTGLPGKPIDGNGVKLADAEDYTVQNVLGVDTGYKDVVNLEMIDGRWFDADHPTDSSAYVLNELAVTALGLTDPIGQTLDRNGVVGPVIGVVKDFHFATLHETIEPLFVFMSSQSWDFRQLAIKIAPNQVASTLPALKTVWEEVLPDEPFTYSFLDDDLKQLYTAEQRLGQIFGVFAGLALLISCMGLFGLAAFTAEQRTKEIGVRKVLGASVSGIVGLLSKDFLRLVLIAFVIATPLAFYGMQRWLEDFAYRVEIGWEIFIVASLMASAIAILTVSYQSIKAALSNPIDALRYE